MISNFQEISRLWYQFLSRTDGEFGQKKRATDKLELPSLPVVKKRYNSQGQNVSQPDRHQTALDQIMQILRPLAEEKYTSNSIERRAQYGDSPLPRQQNMVCYYYMV
jgi:hypothetical protein